MHAPPFPPLCILIHSRWARKPHGHSVVHGLHPARQARFLRKKHLAKTRACRSISGSFANTRDSQRWIYALVHCPPVDCAWSCKSNNFNRLREALGQLRQVYADRLFWRLAPMGVFCSATSMAVLGLWAGPWLKDVGGLPPEGVARTLLAGAAAMAVGSILTGGLADLLGRRGTSRSNMPVAPTRRSTCWSSSWPSRSRRRSAG